MDVFPKLRVERFHQLKLGELFIFADAADAGERFYAMKVQALESGDDAMMIPLGPQLPAPLDGCYLLQWQAATVLSLGPDFQVVLPSEPSAWSVNGLSRDPICLAMSGDQPYVCANSSNHPSMFAPVYVNMKTGEICKRLAGSAVYTNSWAIDIGDGKGRLQRLIQYPIKQKGDVSAER
jgi:hypothetical protein